MRDKAREVISFIGPTGLGEGAGPGRGFGEGVGMGQGRAEGGEYSIAPGKVGSNEWAHLSPRLHAQGI